MARYAQRHEEMTAAEAVGFFASSPDACVFEVLIPRSIKASEITSVRPAPQLVGWRYFPEAKGKRAYWPEPGSFKASSIRRAVDDRYGG